MCVYYHGIIYSAVWNTSVVGTCIGIYYLQPVGVFTVALAYLLWIKAQKVDKEIQIASFFLNTHYMDHAIVKYVLMGHVCDPGAQNQFLISSKS